MTECPHPADRLLFADFDRRAKYRSGRYCLDCGQCRDDPSIVLEAEFLEVLRVISARWPGELAS